MGNTESFFQKHYSSIKIIIIGVIALLMLVPLAMIQELVRDRENNFDKASEDVGRMWSRPQIVVGPVIEISTECINPDSLSIDGVINTETLHKSIYDVIVYHSSLEISGFFVIPGEVMEQMDGENVSVSMSVSDMRGIEERVFLVFEGNEYEMTSSSDNDGVFKAKIRLDKKNRYAFSVGMKLKGSKSLEFAPIGNVTEVKLESEYGSPKFCGEFLPSERQVDESGFSASWKVLRMNRSIPQESAFGVELLVPVTQYQQTNRAVKYGILIILLVFLSAYIVEITTKKEINFLQYLLIGFALALFYSLLLSISEFISFGLAYLIASAMTVLMLGGYFGAIFRSRHAAYIVGLLIILYAFIYLLLQMESYALLVGTMGLFIILGMVMYFTRKRELL